MRPLKGPFGSTAELSHSSPQQYLFASDADGSFWEQNHWEEGQFPELSYHDSIKETCERFLRFPNLSLALNGFLAFLSFGFLIRQPSGLYTPARLFRLSRLLSLCHLRPPLLPSPAQTLFEGQEW